MRHFTACFTIKSFEDYFTKCYYKVFNIAVALPGGGVLKCSKDTEASGNSKTCFNCSPKEAGGYVKIKRNQS